MRIDLEQKQDLRTEHLQDIVEGERQGKMSDQLNELDVTELIDYMPSEEVDKMKQELIGRIISEGWYDE